MMYKARTAYLVVAWLFLVGVLSQVFLAGLGIFAHSANFITYVAMGGVLHGLSALMWVLAALGRTPLKTTRLTGLLFALLTLQGLLPHLSGSIPALAALHPVNALFIFWMALILARRAQAFVRAPQKPAVLARRPVHQRPTHSMGG